MQTFLKTVSSITNAINIELSMFIKENKERFPPHIQKFENKPIFTIRTPTKKEIGDYIKFLNSRFPGNYESHVLVKFFSSFLNVKSNIEGLKDLNSGVSLIHYKKSTEMWDVTASTLGDLNYFYRKNENPWTKTCVQVIGEDGYDYCYDLAKKRWFYYDHEVGTKILKDPFDAIARTHWDVEDMYKDSLSFFLKSLEKLATKSATAKTSAAKTSSAKTSAAKTSAAKTSAAKTSAAKTKPKPASKKK